MRFLNSVVSSNSFLRALAIRGALKAARTPGRRGPGLRGEGQPTATPGAALLKGTGTRDLLWLKVVSLEES